ncbi:3'-5' exoribonuclease domain-containing protein [Mycobacteroides chelonae]|uniref:3'-5' exoribonuclease domain-containing protein n=1 Tax=Mycobacteroides chelonae TaxID=1774 RepID=UPI0008A8C6A1|nr:3'-5' exoribonuclease [Mycobacteroides chelonae]OHU29054.1 hypothetical protein BKG78_23585 [Mycobacteroides chelonae]
MTIYCYDTEFLEDGKTIELISIGIVCEDGREYYAVNSDMDQERIRGDRWLLANVWPHLPLQGYKTKPATIGGTIKPILDTPGKLDTTSVLVKPKWVIANEVREFIVGDLAARDEAVSEDELPDLWAYYGAYDHVALCQLWGRMINHPRFMPMYTHDLKQEMDRLGVGSNAVPQPKNAHDALTDARWNWSMLRDIRHRQLMERA